MCIRHLFISPGRNLFGHPEQPPGQHPVLECDEIEGVAGQGVRGDLRACILTDGVLRRDPPPAP